MSKNTIIIVILFILILFGFLGFFIVFDTKTVDNVRDVGVGVEDDSDLMEVGLSNSEDVDNSNNGSNENTCSIDGLANNSSGCSVDVTKSEGKDTKGNNEKKEVEEIFGTKKGDLAYDFELVNLAGEKVKLSDYRGKKPVIIEFWNSWCHNCQREMPKLQKTYEKYDGKFEIIGVNLLSNKGLSDIEDSEEKVRSFVKKYNITFPIIFDEKLLAARKYKIKATNHHFLINTDGTIYDSFFIDLEEEVLEEFLKFNGIK